MKTIRLALAALATFFVADMAHSAPLTFKARSQSLSATGGGKYKPVETEVTWEASKTAVVIVDMWDDHWCPNAAKRVAEMAKPMNELLRLAREKGLLIIHAPSSTVDFYKDTPARKRAKDAPTAKPPVSLSKDVRWGTNWCWPNKSREPDLPIDDTDMGCDCEEEYPIREAWTRQIDLIEIDAERDAITDNGQEAYNLLAQHGIDNVILMGVHLNMCVLGRPVGIRQMVTVGKNVVLMRDMTDTMYNPKKRPFVSHFAGTDLVVQHVEKFWCPSITRVNNRLRLETQGLKSSRGSLRSRPVYCKNGTPIMPSGNDLRRGMAVKHKGEVAVVLECQHRTPPKTRAFVQATLRSIRTGKSFDTRFSSTEKVDVIPLNRRKMEYSYRAGDDFVFTDPETYEPETIMPELVGDAVDYMVENCEVEITFIEGNPAVLELPSSVVLTVTDSPEGVKGDSTTNVMKTVTLETGKKIQAPLFIKNGERLKIDTREGKYMERVNK